MFSVIWCEPEKCPDCLDNQRFLSALIFSPFQPPPTYTPSKMEGDPIFWRKKHFFSRAGVALARTLRVLSVTFLVHLTRITKSIKPLSWIFWVPLRGARSSLALSINLVSDEHNTSLVIIRSFILRIFDFSKVLDRSVSRCTTLSSWNALCKSLQPCCC